MVHLDLENGDLDNLQQKGEVSPWLENAVLPSFKPSTTTCQLTRAEIILPAPSSHEELSRHAKAIEDVTEILHFHPRWGSVEHEKFGDFVYHLLSTGDRLQASVLDEIAGADQSFDLTIKNQWSMTDNPSSPNQVRRLIFKHSDTTDLDDEDETKCDAYLGVDTLIESDEIDLLSLEIECPCDQNEGLVLSLTTHGVCDEATMRSWDKLSYLLDEFYQKDIDALFGESFESHATLPLIKFNLPNRGSIEAYWLDLPPCCDDIDRSEIEECPKIELEPLVMILRDPQLSILRELGEELKINNLSQIIELGRQELQEEEDFNRGRLTHFAALGVSTVSLSERLAVGDMTSTLSKWIVLDLASASYGGFSILLSEDQVVFTITPPDMYQENLGSLPLQERQSRYAEMEEHFKSIDFNRLKKIAGSSLITR